MKKILRMIIFSGVALYLTGLWNRGFTPSFELRNFITATLVIAVLFYLINPLSKLILLPINILTLGLFSTIIYFFLFHFLLNYFSVIEIKSWIFPGLSVNGFVIKKIAVNYWANICLSAFSVSTIINLLEKIL